jgi:hypothetical protein
MRWSRRFAIVLLSCGTVPLPAATAYHVTFTGSGASRPALRVTSDADRRRIDLEKVKDSVITWSSLISSDGGHTFVALNAENQTWFPLKAAAPLSPSSALLAGLPTDRISDVRWDLQEEPATDETGANRKYVGRLSYRRHFDTSGVAVAVRCSAVLLTWTTDRTDQTLWVGALPFASGVADVEAELAKKAAAIKGFPIKITLSATRQYEGGPPMTELVTASVTNIHEVTVPAADFRRPTGYREQEPVIGGAGRSLRP